MFICCLVGAYEQFIIVIACLYAVMPYDSLLWEWHDVDNTGSLHENV
jgi:hypothetical protein